MQRSPALFVEGGIIRKHPWVKFGTGHRGSLSAYGRKVAQASMAEHAAEQTDAKIDSGDANIDANLGVVGPVDPSDPLPPLTSESEPDGGPVGRETRRRLVEWWQKEYCAGRMKLAILGRG